eukprot:6855861-Prymnesium_polylepis.1
MRIDTVRTTMSESTNRTRQNTSVQRRVSRSCGPYLLLTSCFSSAGVCSEPPNQPMIVEPRWVERSGTPRGGGWMPKRAV